VQAQARGVGSADEGFRRPSRAGKAGKGRPPPTYLMEEVAQALGEEANVGCFAPKEEVQGGVHQRTWGPCSEVATRAMGFWCCALRAQHSHAVRAGMHAGALGSELVLILNMLQRHSTARQTARRSRRASASPTPFHRRQSTLC